MPVPVDKFEYLLVCLSKCEQFEPNYHAVAEELKISSANNAWVSLLSWSAITWNWLHIWIRQKAFKKYVEESGKYKLVNRKVVPNPDYTGSSAPATPAVTPSKRASKTAANDEETPKKRKVAPKKKTVPAKQAPVEEEVGSDENTNEDEI